MTTEILDPAADLIKGTAAIAAFLGESERRTFYMLARRAIPGFKLAGRWYLRRSTYAHFLAAREAEALKGSTSEAA